MGRWKWITAGLMAMVVLMSALGTAVHAAPASNAQPAEAEAEMTDEEKAEAAWQKELDDAYKLPIQTNNLKKWPQGPGTYGDAAIVMEAGTGAILYAKNMDKKEFPASITKLLTALLAFEYAEMTDEVRITADSLACLGSGYASIGLKEGDVITMEQALYALLLASSNEVCHAVGEAIAQKEGQDYNWFLSQMNEKCEELGGEHSNFVNTNGVHDEQHYTCAQDMAFIARELFQYPEFFTISQTTQYTIPASDTCEEHVFQQKHQMLLEGNEDFYEYAVAGKTGYTTEAENTLVTMADNGEMQLICVVFREYAGHVYSDTRALFDYVFDNFSKVSVETEDSSADIKKVLEDSYVVLPDKVKLSSLEQEIVKEEDSGEKARVVYTYKGNPVGAANVEVSSSYQKGSGEVSTESKQDGEKQEKAFPLWLKLLLGAAALAFLIVVCVFYAAVQRRKRRRRRRRQQQMMQQRRRQERQHMQSRRLTDRQVTSGRLDEDRQKRGRERDGDRRPRQADQSGRYRR